MAAPAKFTIPFNVADLGSDDIYRVDWLVETNAEQGRIEYPALNWTFYSGSVHAFPGGSGELELPVKTDALPGSFEFKLTPRVWVKGGVRGGVERAPYYCPAPSATTPIPLGDLADESSVPESWMSTATARLSSIASQAQSAFGDLAALVGGLAGVKNPGALVPWRLALANAGTSAAKVVVIGDSITEGAIVSSWQKAWPHVLQTRLREIAGVTGGIGYIAATTTADAAVPALPLTSHGTPEMWIHGLGGRAMQLSTVEDHVTYASTPCTKIRVYYGKTTIAGGGLKVSIDGVDQGVTLLSQAVGGVVSGGHVWESPTLPMGSHVVKIEASHAPFAGVLEGVEFLNGESAAGVRVYNAAHYGGHTAAFTASQMASSWQSVAAVEPDLVTIMLGANDLFELTTAQFLTNIDLMIDKIPAGVPVLLLGCYLRGDRVDDPSEVGQWQDMQAGLRARAAGRVAYLDLAPHWPALASDGSTSAGLMAAGEIPPIHPSDAGAALIATVLAAGVGPDAAAFRGPVGPAGPNTLPAKEAIDSLGAELIGEESELATALYVAIESGAAPVADAAATATTGTIAAPSGGTTNDAPKLAAMMAATPPGGVVQLRPGTYRIASILSIDKPVTFRGAGKGQTTLLMVADRAFSADSSGVTFERMTFHAPAGLFRFFVDSKTVAANRTNWTFRDCKFDGVGMNVSRIGGTLPNGTATTVGADVSDVTVRDCEVTGYKGQYGIELQGVTSALVTGCWIHHCGSTDNLNGEGVKVLYGAKGVRIVNNTIEQNYRDGVDVYNGSEVLISSNVLRNNAQWGVEAKWANADAALVNDAYRIMITGNQVHGNGSGGLTVSPHGTICEGNQVWGHAGKGIVATGAFDASTTAYSVGVIIRGNRVRGGLYGIEFSGAVKDGVIAENIVTGATVDGIALQPQTQDCIVTGNRSYENANRGIRINGSGHRIGPNRSQDAGDVYVTPGVTGCSAVTMTAVG